MSSIVGDDGETEGEEEMEEEGEEGEEEEHTAGRRVRDESETMERKSGLRGMKKKIVKSRKSNQSMVGERIRRKNQKENRALIELLTNQVKAVTKEKEVMSIRAEKAEKLLAKKTEDMEVMKENRNNDNNWLKHV